MKSYVRILIILVVVLVLLGTLLVFSASGTYSAMKFNSFYHLFKLHLWKVFAALFLMGLFSLIPYEFYKTYSKQLLFGILFLLVITMLFAAKVKGAARWIDLGLFKFQPSGLAKLILIIHLATLIERKGDILSDYKQGLIYPLFWIFAIAGLVLIQPNVSTSLIIVLTSFTILFVGGARFKHLLSTFLTIGIIGGGIIMLLPHSRARIMSYVNSLLGNGDINLQVNQAKIALGSGGWLGVGIGHSRQSDLFLPESYGDFIFSILGEEIGFIGAILTLLFYLGIFILGIIIAKRAQDEFGQMLAFGLSFNIIISAFINASVVMGLFPTTGITLPFISFGGTSIILFCISIGIIINIARQNEKIREMRLAQV